MLDSVKPVGERKPAVVIENLPHGGYVVTEAGGDRGYYTPRLMATLDVEEALAFVRHMLTGESLPSVWPNDEAV